MSYQIRVMKTNQLEEMNNQASIVNNIYMI